LCLVLQEGWTPLHLAVQGGRTDIINLLVARGADPAIQNKVMQLDHTSSFSPYIIYLFIYLISKFIYLLSYIILIENGCESHGLAF
jgi:ankyrin repeat protein